MAENVSDERTAYLERALFMIGEQDAGKSTQLRSMFLDRRLGTGSVVPTKKKLPAVHPLSNERWLYLRLTSPHEAEEDLATFLQKCRSNMAGGHRWNFAGPLQPSGSVMLGDAPAVISAFVSHFQPERVRAVLLSPDRFGQAMVGRNLAANMAALRAIPRVEVILCDATSREANGLVYADFFDFT